MHVCVYNCFVYKHCLLSILSCLQMTVSDLEKELEQQSIKFNDSQSQAALSVKK